MGCRMNRKIEKKTGFEAKQVAAGRVFYIIHIGNSDVLF